VFSGLSTFSILSFICVTPVPKKKKTGFLWVKLVKYSKTNLKLKGNFQELRINWLVLLVIKFSNKISVCQEKKVNIQSCIIFIASERKVSRKKKSRGKFHHQNVSVKDGPGNIKNNVFC
jgi:hypothetical protein